MNVTEQVDKQAFTPGPWGYYKSLTVLEGNGDFNIHSDAEPELPQTWLAVVLAREEAKANARLIAAAPELLRELEAIANGFLHRAPEWAGWDTFITFDRLASMRAAIAKARGVA